MAPQPTTVGAQVAVDFHILDHNGNKHTGSLSFSDTASGTTYTDAVNSLRNLITNKIDYIENILPPETIEFFYLNISDFFYGGIDIQIIPGLGIAINLPPIIIPPPPDPFSPPPEPIIYTPNPIIIRIQISNIGIKWHHKE